ncbi:hypothetical protein EI94DRAFT_823740 [Lactarius quietus]|nr:hypothetical protein EI94DRAFT_823740 [Lactarius quietus]
MLFNHLASQSCKIRQIVSITKCTFPYHPACSLCFLPLIPSVIRHLPLLALTLPVTPSSWLLINFVACAHTPLRPGALHSGPSASPRPYLAPPLACKPGARKSARPLPLLEKCQLPPPVTPARLLSLCVRQGALEGQRVREKGVKRSRGAACPSRGRAGWNATHLARAERGSAQPRQ